MLDKKAEPPLPGRMSPREKMDEALKMALEALDDEARERAELLIRFDFLRTYCQNIKAGIEVIVHLVMMEDTDDRSPEEVAEAVMQRLQEKN